jgi:hypothetical protein
MSSQVIEDRLGEAVDSARPIRGPSDPVETQEACPMAPKGPSTCLLPVPLTRVETLSLTWQE